MGVLCSLFIPRKYAGSLYRIEQDLQQVIEGDLTRKIMLRAGDDAEILANQLNRLISFFRTEVESILYGLSKAHEMSASDTGTLPEQQLEAVRILHLNLVEELKGLKVSLEPEEHPWDKSEYTVYVGEANGSANCPD